MNQDDIKYDYTVYNNTWFAEEPVFKPVNLKARTSGAYGKVPEDSSPFYISVNEQSVKIDEHLPSFVKKVMKSLTMDQQCYKKIGGHGIQAKCINYHKITHLCLKIGQDQYG